jgi:nucleotide-binding universal stress UspA family protein
VARPLLNFEMMDNALLKRILIPLDGSATSERALIQARRLLRPDAEVILVHVIESLALDAVLQATQLPRLRAEASQVISRSADSLRSAGIRVRTQVREGLAWEQIVEAAMGEGASLIAMTTHGRTGLSRWVLGSVAEKVIRTSPIPVLALHSFEAGPAGSSPAAKELAFHKLLVPIGGGELSLSSLEPAACLAKACGSKLTLVHIESRLDFPPGTFTTHSVDRPKGFPGLEIPEDPAARLEYAGALLAYQGLNVVTVRVGGDAASRIVDLPEELGADAIVMASRARQGLSRLVLGSVTERVLRHSPLPLLIVPPDRRA